MFYVRQEQTLSLNLTKNKNVAKNNLEVELQTQNSQTDVN